MHQLKFGHAAAASLFVVSSWVLRACLRAPCRALKRQEEEAARKQEEAARKQEEEAARKQEEEARKQEEAARQKQALADAAAKQAKNQQMVDKAAEGFERVRQKKKEEKEAAERQKEEVGW